MKKSANKKIEINGEFRTNLEDVKKCLSASIRIGQNGLSNAALTHCPLIAITEDAITVIRHPHELLGFDDGVDVIQQWRGQWRSDFFKFKVKDFREWQI